MSAGCPDWTELTAHRYERRGRAGARWESALAHLDDCESCRRRALEADPTLLFRRTAAAPLADGELEALRVSVKALRGAARTKTGRRDSRRRYGSLTAVLLLAVLAVLAVGGEFRPEPAPAPSPPPESASSMRFGDRRVAPLDLASPPMVEAIDRPGARIYELPQEDLSLVMIVDESLDV